jgi:hypothetical protein
MKKITIVSTACPRRLVMHCSIWLYQSSIEKLGRGKYSCSFSRSVSDEEKSFIIFDTRGPEITESQATISTERFAI